MTRFATPVASTLAALALFAGACTDDPGVAAEPRESATIPAVGDSETRLEPNATVERIVDGDTLIAVIDGQRERVRLLGIDTPESVAENRPDQCFGEESSDYLKSLLPEGTDITLIIDEEPRDQYDRLLAYVVRTSGEVFINLELIEQGFAGVLIYDPNDHYESLFRAAERDAIDAGMGLWTVCGGPDVPLE